MPIFYFNVLGPTLDVPDLAGRNCTDEGAARAEAERLAAEIVEAALTAGEIPPEAVIEVDDEALRPVLALPVSGAGG